MFSFKDGKLRWSFNPTPGPYRLVEGDPGFPGTREQPPDPPEPPVIVATARSDDGAEYEVAVAIVDSQAYTSVVASDAGCYDDGTRYAGDVADTGRLLAASWTLFQVAREARERLAKARTVGAAPLRPMDLLEIENILYDALRLAEYGPTEQAS